MAGCDLKNGYYKLSADAYKLPKAGTFHFHAGMRGGFIFAKIGGESFNVDYFDSDRNNTFSEDNHVLELGNCG